MSGRESPARVLLIAFGVSLFCALLVSTVVYVFRPMQAAHRSSADTKAILVAAGLAGVEEPLNDREIFNRFSQIHPQLYDLNTGRVVESDPVLAGLYNFRIAADDPDQSVPIPEGQDPAGLGRRPIVMPLYKVTGGDRADSVVVPVYGRGMWSVIYGYIGLGDDLTTITGVVFHEHGETAGIGDRIQRPEWLATWVGKRAYRADGTVGLRVGGDPSATEEMERIDSITGATVTTTGVDRLVRYWLGPGGWGPVLGQLRSEAD